MSVGADSRCWAGSHENYRISYKWAEKVISTLILSRWNNKSSSFDINLPKLNLFWVTNEHPPGSRRRDDARGAQFPYDLPGLERRLAEAHNARARFRRSISQQLISTRLDALGNAIAETLHSRGDSSMPTSSKNSIEAFNPKHPMVFRVPHS